MFLKVKIEMKFRLATCLTSSKKEFKTHMQFLIKKSRLITDIFNKCSKLNLFKLIFLQFIKY